MSGKWEAWEVYVPPPQVNGSSLAAGKQTNAGCRAVAVTAVAVEVKLTGDIFLQPPDAAGNQATNDMTDSVIVRVKSDGDDLCVLFAGSGLALTPDPTATGTSANVCDTIDDGFFEDYVVSPKSCPSMYVRSRNGNAGAIARYRLSSPIAGSR